MSSWKNLGLVLLMLLGLLASAPLLGATKVDWEPVAVEATIAIQDRVPSRVTLHIHTDLPETILEATPSLEGIVLSITPNNLPALSAGTEVTIDLVLSAKALETIDGTIHLREKTKSNGKKGKGKTRTLSKPLPITVIGVATMEETLPPEPDPEENNATLLGVDSNENGIRDDVERFIVLTWTDPNERQALQSYAKSLSLTYDPVTFEQAHFSIHDRLTCTAAIFGVYDAMTPEDHRERRQANIDAINAVRMEVLNTFDRTRAYLDYNASRSGTSTRMSPPSTQSCDFVNGGTQ